MSGYSYIFFTIFFTVYGQLILKWRIEKFGDLPETIEKKIIFLTKILFDPWIFSGLLGAFIASFFWMAAMTKFELSYAYPFTALAYVFILLFSVFMLHESFNWYKAIGVLFIIAGIIIVSKGA